MNDQRNFEGMQTPPVHKKSPVHPAIASAILGILAYLAYLYGTSGSKEALSILPVVPIISLFSAGTLAFTVLKRPLYALLSSVAVIAAIPILSYLFGVQLVGDVILLAFPVLTAFVAGASMGVCTRKKMDMTSSIIITAVIPSAIICATVVIHSIISTGSPT